METNGIKKKEIENALGNSKSFGDSADLSSAFCLDRLIKSPGRKIFSLTDSSFSYFSACPKNQFHLQCKKREKAPEETFYVQH